jgi:membrane protein implicated in regulation of membrane protease activity
MSACTVWELVLTVAVVVCAGLAYHYRNVASRMKTRARIYIQYVPREQLTGEERVVLEDFKKDLGLT